MANARTCAHQAISNFVASINQPPNWAGLVPGETTNGWSASKSEWRRQCRRIMDDFELCVGVKIERNDTEIDQLRKETLATLKRYLVELADVASAKVAVQVAQDNLRSAKANLTKALEQ